jgi:hypothetical protein
MQGIQNNVTHIRPYASQYHIRLIFTEDPDVLYIVLVPAGFAGKTVVKNLKNHDIISIVL